MTYTNELEVTVDFSDVDPNLLEDFSDGELVSTLSSSSISNNDSSLQDDDSKTNSDNVENPSKLNPTGKSSRFFRKKD